MQVRILATIVAIVSIGWALGTLYIFEGGHKVVAQASSYQTIPNLQDSKQQLLN